MSEVPEACFMAMPTSDSMSGTMMKPPPTPTYPDATPAIRPMPAPTASWRRVIFWKRGGSPEASA